MFQNFTLQKASDLFSWYFLIQICLWLHSGLRVDMLFASGNCVLMRAKQEKQIKIGYLFKVFMVSN